MAIPVMNRLGSPAALAKCHPSDVMRLGGALPPTFVASFSWKPVVQWFRTSHASQNPTYAASPYTLRFEMVMPPESNTDCQQFCRHVVSPGSICWVFGPNVDSRTWLPAVMR